MKRCSITYELLKGKHHYSQSGLKLLSPKLESLFEFPYTAKEQREKAEALSSKLSIQGVQPKLSAVLSIKDKNFKIVDHGGKFIMKPQVERYLFLPENEDLTMRLASHAGIGVPLHGLIHSKDGSLTYFIKRFDRHGQKGKFHLEDFAQLSGRSRETKYDSSMEKVAEIIERFCTFPKIEKLKLFNRTLFSFLVGNEDMHLKNFSLLVSDDQVRLSPAYDLLNSTIALSKPNEEMALPLHGKKKNLTRNDLISYFASERLQLSDASLTEVLEKFKHAIPYWQKVIRNSFLPAALQKRYLKVLRERASRIFF